jgi:hypothetical protein
MFNQEQQNEVIKRRHEVVVAYCKQKGWEPNPDTLTIEQIMEIRAQKEWKDVPQNVLKGN